MTCIVGLIDKDYCNRTVWIGGDSCGSAENAKDLYVEPKIFEKNGLLFGYTTSYRMGQLIQYNMDFDVDWANFIQYMHTDFIDSLRECLKTGGFAYKDKEVEFGGNFIVGGCGHLFLVQNDFSILESQHGFLCCGSGEHYAQSCLWSTKDLGFPPEERVKMALECAEIFAIGVQGPFTIKANGGK